MKTKALLLLAVLALCTQAPARAQEAKKPAENPAHDELRVLRSQLLDAINTKDTDALVALLDKDVVVTWMDGTVSRGPQGVREYIEEMTKGPNRKIDSYKADAEVDELTHLYGETGVASGKSKDEVVQADGQKFTVNTRWTTTLVKKDGKWKVASFHGSTSMFDNPVLHMVRQQTAIRIGAIASGVGFLVGIVGTLLLRRRQPAPGPPSA